MFAGSSLSSLSSTSELSDLPEDEAVAPPAAAQSTTIVPDGPFASQPDLEAVKYLKDTSAQRWLARYDPMEGSSHNLLKLLGVTIPPEMPEEYAVKLLRKTMHRLRSVRDKLPQYNTIDDVIKLLRKSRKIMVLTGAGISVSCGIPDFRSPQGLYANLQREGKYDLDDPQQMFDIDYFKLYPEVFYSFASSIYPSNFIPSPCHRFVKLLENRGQLLRNYTQNIDNIESRVGLKRIFQCHGSFATASCIVCRNRVPGSAIEENIFSHTIPWCELCTKRQNKLRPGGGGRKSTAGNTTGASSAGPSGPTKSHKKKRKSGWDADDDDGSNDAVRHIMKPDITFFGEQLHSNFDDLFIEDIKREDFDCLLIIGTSLKVAPVADIVYRIPHSIPQILINKTPTAHGTPDVMLLGDADEIVQYLCERLGKGWTLPPALADVPPPPQAQAPAQATKDDERKTKKGKGIAASTTTGGKNTVVMPKAPATLLMEPARIGASHVWMFSGAEPGPLLLPRPPRGNEGESEKTASGMSNSEGSSLTSLGDDVNDALTGSTTPMTVLTLPPTTAPSSSSSERASKRVRRG